MSWRPTSDPGRLRFSDLLHRSGSVDDKRYVHQPDSKKLREALAGHMETYNEHAALAKATPLDLALFEDAVDHLCRILRVFGMRRGHLLLVGTGGTGRRSLCSLAAFIHEAERLEVEPARVSDFPKLLKGVLRSCGVRGQCFVLQFAEAALQDDVLETLATLVTHGEIPGFWRPEEVSNMLAEVNTMWQTMEDPQTVWQRLLADTRRLVHVVLSVSPGPRLRALFRDFPGLAAGCVVNRIQTWPEEAMLAIAQAKLDKLPAALTGSRAYAGIVSTTLRLHGLASEASAKQLPGALAHLPSRWYLDFLEVFSGLYQEREKQLRKACARLSTGLQGLRGAGELVAELDRQFVAVILIVIKIWQ